MIQCFRILIAAAMCASISAGARANTIVVTQSGFGFTPANVTIDVGDTVQWVWTAGDHTVSEGTDGTVDGNELFHSLLDGATQMFSFTFTQAVVTANPRPGGVYDYFCEIHFAIPMTGTVTVNSGTGTAYCLGDGSGTACPCGNQSGVGANAGCLNSLGSAGALAGSGTPSISGDTVVLAGSGMPDSSALYFQGTAQVATGAGAAFGDGLRCVGGAVVRLGLKTNSGGSSTWPSGADPSVSVRGGASSGSTLNYQVWYRNAAAFCTASTFNLTNGYAVSWTP